MEDDDRLRTSQREADEYEAEFKELLGVEEWTKAEERALAFVGESDRGVAMVGAAILSDLLGEILKTLFRDRKEVAAQLVDDPDSGSLAAFYARIKLVYCLGLVPTRVYEDLNRVRRVRNHFAHTSSAASFEADPVRSLCLELGGTSAKTYTREPRMRFHYVVGELEGCLSRILAATRKFMPAVSNVIWGSLSAGQRQWEATRPRK